MGRLDQFEFPLPILKIDVDKIEIETSGGCEGSFFVKNVGGSELEGQITSNSRNIVFSPTAFKGNEIEISYSFVLDFYKLGDEIITSALIMSNGGEAIIPIAVKIIAPAIQTKDGQTITSLEDYCEFAKTSPILSRQMFNQWDFSVWLSIMSYKHMELYEHFTTDPNKERAVDNFLILNKLKEKSEVSICSKKISLAINPNSGEAITDAFSFIRTDWGYVDVRVQVKTGGLWLKLSKDKLASTDFNGDNYAELYFMVLPDLLQGSLNCAYIEVESDSEIIGGINVEVKKKQSVVAEIDRPSYHVEDEGFLNITNNTGKDLIIEIAAVDSFVKFEAKRYFITEFAKINFQIKMAQFYFRKQSVTKTKISVKVISTEITYRKEIELSIGGF